MSAQKMKVEWWDAERVVPYEGNPRDNDAAVEPLAASLREFGWKQPIVVDSDGVIVAGHTRLKAAKLLGMEKVPVLVASDLTPAQCAAYRLADNKTAELASWDMGALAVELDGLAVDFDMGQFGFDSSDFGLPKTLDDVQEVDVPDDAPAVCKRGDVWQLGEHRLMCGDSSDPSDMAILVAGGGR